MSAWVRVSNRIVADVAVSVKVLWIVWVRNNAVGLDEAVKISVRLSAGSFSRIRLSPIGITRKVSIDTPMFSTIPSSILTQQGIENVVVQTKKVVRARELRSKTL